MKFLRNKKIIIIFSGLAAVFFFSRLVFAVWDGLPYDPWETLNPECLPTDVDCDVASPLTAANISDTAYGVAWDTDATHAPSKNSVYDKIEALNIIPTVITVADTVDPTAYVALFERDRRSRTQDRCWINLCGGYGHAYCYCFLRAADGK